MPRLRTRLLYAVAGLLLVVGHTVGRAQSAPEATMRTVYVTAVDRDGQPVAGLTTADFTMKESGKDGLVLSVAPARARGQRQVPVNAGKGIVDIARERTQSEAERPVMVVLALDTGAPVTMRHDYVFGTLRDSRVQMHVVAISGGGMGGDLSRILSDGPQQSGGRHQIGVSALSAVPGAMEQIATDLAGQHALTCTRLVGEKPSGRLALSLVRRGVAPRAPARVPVD